MTQMTDEQGQQLEVAARSVAAKLHTFQEGLTTDERTMLGLAFNAIAAARSEEDVAGYSDTDPIGEMQNFCLTMNPPLWLLRALGRRPY